METFLKFLPWIYATYIYFSYYNFRRSTEKKQDLQDEINRALRKKNMDVDHIMERQEGFKNKKHGV